MIGVSVIVPIYNAGEFLRPCLDSLRAQTLQDIEFICVLDCPTDGSDSVARTYAEEDSRFRILANPSNLHIGQSRNRGMAAARGEYIGFCDHDDTVDPDFYQRLYELAVSEKSPVVESLDTYHASPSSGSDWMRYGVEQALRDLIRGGMNFSSSSIWTHIYRRDFLCSHQLTFVDTRQVALEDRLFNAAVFQALYADGVASYPYMLTNCYHHLIEHTNGSYFYRNLDHISRSLAQFIQIVRSDKDGRLAFAPEIQECIGRYYYNSMRYEIRENGLLSSIRKLCRVVSNHPDIAAYIRCYPGYLSALTLPKNILMACLKMCVSPSKSLSE